MEQIILDACKQINIDPKTIVESTVRIEEGGVTFVADLGIKGSPRFSFKRLLSGTVEYSRTPSSFTGLIGGTPQAQVPPVQPTPTPPSVPVASVNVGFAKTQELTPQKRAWEQRRKAAAAATTTIKAKTETQ